MSDPVERPFRIIHNWPKPGMVSKHYDCPEIQNLCECVLPYRHDGEHRCVCGTTWAQDDWSE